MSNQDWFYEQGSPDPYEEEPEVCSSCEYTNCQCDAANDYYKDK